ncbi:hypothetical protein B4U80_04558 [Leptotrombidium deliense]|uniref:RING-type E3 ubiquitin transferase n=1 Tax=Leptotrombidium deliense TaxID=299467 RepID=A0A443SPK3_9ACAR|nr:hypothetical protein B4U80_04558 [Leptotrombidium deliense]
MPLSNTANDFMQCPICFNAFSLQRKPVTLICSHTCCLSCLKSLQYCPFDQTVINRDLPENEAILALLNNRLFAEDVTSKLSSQCVFGVEPEDLLYYCKSVECVKQMAVFLKPQPTIIQSTNHATLSLSRPMQRKLISLLHCQLVEGEGRSRAARNARSIGERALSELLIKHQDPHTLSAKLWAAVRSRGCQFLGPAMQEEVLRLVLLALEDGSALSRKVLVMFVVQRLSPHFPHQASKTAIGHVIQLLYRASCFKLTKREGDSSLMQLKEEYCSYEALRREHDTQIISIALEAGLRISPDQCSSLLYGDTAHKSHMQSIIDKLQSSQSFHQSIQELVIALQRTGDPGGLSALKEHFERLAQFDASPKSGEVQICLSTCFNSYSHPTHQELSLILESSKTVTFCLVDFLQQFGGNTVKPGFRPQNGNLIKPRINRPKPFTSKLPSPSSPVIDYHISGGRDVCHSLTVPPIRVLTPTSPPMAIMKSPVLSPSSFQTIDQSQNPIHLTAVPTIFVGSATSAGQTSEVTNTNCSKVATGLSRESVVRGSGTQERIGSISSEDDQFIPFADRPFVSKYGPISRVMSLINTPTVVGPGSGSQQSCLVGNSCTDTQPTNVILGRTAVPSLTLIQPLQQLVLRATSVITEHSQESEHSFNGIPHFQSSLHANDQFTSIPQT